MAKQVTLGRVLGAAEDRVAGSGTPGLVDFEVVEEGDHAGPESLGG